MKPFSPDLEAALEEGRVEYRDAVELHFDSGSVRMLVGVRGQFAWDDAEGVIPPWRVGSEDEDLWSDAGYWRDERDDGTELGDAVFYGGGSLVALNVPENALGPESQAITAQVFETYLTEGSDIPVNTFDDGVRASIDEENWEGRPAVLSVFWFSLAGQPIYREQVAVRTMDQMVLETDEDGRPVRTLQLEEPDIMQRDIEGKTSNAAFQSLIDPTDKAFEHVAEANKQEVNFGRVSAESAA